MKNRPIIAEELELVRKEYGYLTADNVVDYARTHPDSAIYRELDWNDTEAAEKWRCIQAGRLIRAVVTVVHTPPTKIDAKVDNLDRSARAYYSLPSARGKTGYEHVDDIMRDKEKRYELLEMAAAELESFRRRYDHLKELTALFDAAEKFKRSLRKPKGKGRDKEARA